jgi:hypothetical protein
VRGDALLEGQEPAQEVELSLGPALDLTEIFGSGHRCAQHDQQDFRQRLNHLPRLARVFKGGKMIEKRLLGHERPR